MANPRNLLERILSSLFSESVKTHVKKRKLGLESLEVREMLSVSPLQYPSDPDDGTPPIYAPQSVETASLPTVEVETVQNIGREGAVVDPLAPIGVTVNNGVHPEFLEVRWNAVDGAASYQVQRSNDRVHWSTVETAVNPVSWDYHAAAAGTENFYRVASIDSDGVLSEYSDVVSGRRKTPIDTPVLSVVSRTENATILEWTKVDNAASYDVWRSTDDGQTWHCVTWTTGTSCRISGESDSPDTVCLFKVQAMTSEDGYRHSAHSNICYSYPVASEPSLPDRPGGLSATASSSSTMAVSWNPGTGADSYKLEMKISSENDWTVIYEGEDTEYSCTDLPENVAYFFRVSSVNTVGTSAPSYEVGGVIAPVADDPMTPTNLRISGEVDLQWDAVPGAAAYRLERSSDAVHWSELWTMAATSYNDWSAGTGTEYFYRVASVDAEGGISDYSTVVSGRRVTPVAVPVFTNMVRNGNSILLEWSSENVKNYLLDVSEDGGLTWNRIAWYTSSTAWIHDISQAPEKEYRFKLQVWEVDEGYKRFEPICEIVSPAVDVPLPLTVPGRPSGLQGESLDRTNIEISWNAAPGADSYRLETASAVGGPWTTVYEGGETEYICTDLTENTFYYYRVSAVNATGDSDASYVISAKTDRNVQTPIVYRISRSGDENADEPLTVCFRLSGAATHLEDYTVSGASYDHDLDYGWAVIPAGCDDVDIALNILEDEIYEPTESVVLTLLERMPDGSPEALYNLGTSVIATATIEDIPEYAEVPNVWIDSVQDGFEGGRDGFFRLRRDDTQNQITVSYAITGSAANGSDYTRISSSIDFAQGQKFADIPINVIDDTRVENTETVTITLQPGNNDDVDQYHLPDSLERPSSATISIFDNDVAPNVWIESVQEGVEGGDNALIRFWRDNAQNALTISYATSGTASRNSDYTIPTYMVFAQGEEYVDMPINIIDDAVVEATETIVLTINESKLGGVDQYLFSDTTERPKTATLTIADNDTAPNVWIDSLQDGTEGGENGFFRLRRDHTQNSLTVYYATTGAAARYSDYTIPTSIVFAQGQEYVDIPVTIVDDEIVEAPETVTITLVERKENGVDQYSLPQTTLKPNSTTINLFDNDIAPNVWIDSWQNGTEGGGNGFIRLCRDNVHNSLIVSYSTAGTATKNADYTVPSTVVFACGEEYVDIPITVIDDDVVEATETVVLTLTDRVVNGMNQYFLPGTLENPKTTTINITDNDIAPNVWVDSWQDGAEGGENAFIRLRRDNTQNPTTINYTTSGTATKGSDYTISSNISFAQGEEYVDIPITVIDDVVVEAVEAIVFTINERKVNGVDQYLLPQTTLKPNSTTINLFDNDTAPNVWIDSWQDGSEGDENGFIRLRRDNADNSLSVSYSTAGTAAKNSDYTILASIVFAQGEEYVDIPITIIDDAIIENSETVIVTLQLRKVNGIDQYYLPSTVDQPHTATITIEDNEAPAPNVWIDSTRNGIEGSQDGYVRLRRDDMRNQTTVYYTVNGTAANGTDYNKIATTVVFAQGEEYIDIPIAVKDDEIVEGDETVIITLQTRKENSVDQYFLPGTEERPLSATITIEDDEAPAPSIWIDSVQNGREGGQNGYFRLRRDDSRNQTKVYYTITGTATRSSDYASVSSPVIFEQGQEYIDIPINVLDDALIEITETVILTLQLRKENNVDQYLLPGTDEQPLSATITIEDNESPAPNVWIESWQGGREGGENGYFRLRRDDVRNQTTVYYTIGGTASNGSDYTSLSTSKIFAPGQEYIDIPIIVKEDIIVEGDETIILTLQPRKENNIDQYLLPGTDERPLSATITIEDNEAPAPNVWIESWQDGQEGGENGYFRLRRDDVRNQTTVYYTVGGTASSGSDYTSISTSKVFAAGQEYIDIPITIKDDAIVEGTETVILTLQLKKENGIDQYYLPETPTKPKSATVTIADNDVAPDVWIDSFQDGSEGGENGFFRLRRSNTQNELIVNLQISGTATKGTDYETISTSVTFQQGAEFVDIPVIIKDDLNPENNETVILTILNRTVNGVAQYKIPGSLENPATATMTIFDNDAATKVWMDASQDACENGEDGFVRIRRDDSRGTLTINYNIGGSAVNGKDYSRLSSSVTFVAGQEFIDIPVCAIDDAIVKPDKTLVITLVAQSQNGALIYAPANTPDKPSSATINILNDDIAPSVWIESTHNGEEGGENGFFRLRRDNSQNQLTVNYAIAGTAINGADYTNIPTNVTFLAGQDYVDIPIVIIDDTMFEPDETVIITLLPTKIDGLDQYILVASEEKPISGTITIYDNDIAPTIGIDSIQDAREAGQNGVFRLRRDNTTNEVTVKYTISEDSTAVRNEDFTIVGFTGTSQIYGLAVFAVGQEYVDIVVNPVDDDLFDGDKTLTIALRQGNENTYLLGGVPVGTLMIFDNDDPAARPVASDDRFLFEPQSSGNGLIVSGNVLHNDLDAGGSLLDVSLHSAVLVDTIGLNDFFLNEDGTFSYSVNSIVAGGSFTYKIVAYDGKESNIATARLSMYNTAGDAEILAPLEEEELPLVSFDETGYLRITDNIGNVIGSGAAGFDFGEGSVFVPPVIGTYTIEHTATTTSEEVNPGDEEEVSTEEVSVMIVSAAYDNGDWVYTETVRWNYADTISSEKYWGGYVYVFTAWSTNGTTGYTYDFRSRDDYDVTTITDETTSDSSTMFQSREVGHTSNSHFRGFWNEAGLGIDHSRTKSSSEYQGNGRYSYEVEGGNVSGTMKESADSFDFSDTFVNFAFDLDTEVWIALSGVYSSISRGNSDSNYDGKGNYEIEDHFTETDSSGESLIRGEIKEKGESNSSYLYEMFGLLAAGAWSIDGAGDSSFEDMSEYENSEKGKYSVQSSTEEQESEIKGNDENNYRDRFSVKRQTAWAVIGGTWTAVGGREEESGSTESYSRAESENNITVYDDYEPIETRIETEAKSEKKDEYSLTRTLSNNTWNASEGNAESYVYGYYCEDVETKEGTYRREMSGGTIEGNFGSLETEMNEFEYSSSSVIGSDGEWRMDDGTGYYRYKSEDGSYSEGEGEYTVEGNGWSYTGEVTESWKLSGGSGGRTEYAVESGAWTVGAEMHTSTSWYRTEETDNAEGTWKSNDTIGDYSREVTNKFSDDREIGYKYRNENEEPEQDGTIKIESNKKYSELFDGSRTGDISSSLTVKEYSFGTSYLEDFSLVFSWQPDDDEEYSWRITSGTHNTDHSYVSETASDSYRNYYTPSDYSTTEIIVCRTSIKDYRDTITKVIDLDKANQIEFSPATINRASEFGHYNNPLKDCWEIESGNKERHETTVVDFSWEKTVQNPYGSMYYIGGEGRHVNNYTAETNLDLIIEYVKSDESWVTSGSATVKERDVYDYYIDNVSTFERSMFSGYKNIWCTENGHYSMLKESTLHYEYTADQGFQLDRGQIITNVTNLNEWSSYAEVESNPEDIHTNQKYRFLDDAYETKQEYDGLQWIYTDIDGSGLKIESSNEKKESSASNEHFEEHEIESYIDTGPYGIYLWAIGYQQSSSKSSSRTLFTADSYSEIQIDHKLLEDKHIVEYNGTTNVDYVSYWESVSEEEGYYDIDVVYFGDETEGSNYSKITNSSHTEEHYSTDWYSGYDHYWISTTSSGFQERYGEQEIKKHRYSESVDSLKYGVSETDINQFDNYYSRQDHVGNEYTYGIFYPNSNPIVITSDWKVIDLYKENSYTGSAFGDGSYECSKFERFEARNQLDGGYAVQTTHNKHEYNYSFDFGLIRNSENTVNERWGDISILYSWTDDYTHECNENPRHDGHANSHQEREWVEDRPPAFGNGSPDTSGGWTALGSMRTLGFQYASRDYKDVIINIGRDININMNGMYGTVVPAVPGLTAAPGGLSSRSLPQGGLADPGTAEMPELSENVDEITHLPHDNPFSLKNNQAYIDQLARWLESIGVFVENPDALVSAGPIYLSNPLASGDALPSNENDFVTVATMNADWNVLGDDNLDPNVPIDADRTLDKAIACAPTGSLRIGHSLWVANKKLHGESTVITLAEMSFNDLADLGEQAIWELVTCGTMMTGAGAAVGGICKAVGWLKKTYVFQSTTGQIFKFSAKTIDAVKEKLVKLGLKTSEQNVIKFLTAAMGDLGKEIAKGWEKADKYFPGWKFVNEASQEIRIPPQKDRCIEWCYRILCSKQNPPITPIITKNDLGRNGQEVKNWIDRMSDLGYSGGWKWNRFALDDNVNRGRPMLIGIKKVDDNGQIIMGDTSGHAIIYLRTVVEDGVEWCEILDPNTIQPTLVLKSRLIELWQAGGYQCFSF